MCSTCHNSAAASKTQSEQWIMNVLELQQDLPYKEHLVRILDQVERRTRQEAIKFLKV